MYNCLLLKMNVVTSANMDNVICVYYGQNLMSVHTNVAISKRKAAFLKTYFRTYPHSDFSVAFPTIILFDIKFYRRISKPYVQSSHR